MMGVGRRDQHLRLRMRGLHLADHVVDIAPKEADPDHYAQRYAHCDVLVVGSGAAGLAAALAASESGKRVILCDEQAEFGGGMLSERATVTIDGMSAAAWADQAVATLAAMPRVTMLKRTTAFGYYAQNFVALAEPVPDLRRVVGMHPNATRRLAPVVGVAERVEIDRFRIDRVHAGEDLDQRVGQRSGARGDRGQDDVRRGDREVVAVVLAQADEAQTDLIGEHRLIHHVPQDLGLVLQGAVAAGTDVAERVEAQLDRAGIDAGLGGTPVAPQLRGGLGLSEGRAFIGPAGVQLEDLRLTLDGDPAAGVLHLEGDARSGPGTAAVEGRLSGLGSADLEGRLRLSGESFEAVNLPEARVLVTPDVTLAVRGRTVAVDGSVHIPEARIEPRDLSGTQTASRDVVLVGREAPPPPGWEVSTRLAVSLGDKVMFDGFGLKGRFTGALEVIDEPQRVTRGRGELKVVDGAYSAYGQALKIETGRVLFRDGPIDNPGLDVRAVRRSGDILAGVKVFGQLREPQVELYSQPNLPQADQLSYLLLGRPVASASGGEGELLMRAATSLGLKGGNLLAQTIGSSFGFDEVSVGGGDEHQNSGMGAALGGQIGPAGLNDLVGAIAKTGDLTPQALDHIPLHVDDGVSSPSRRRHHLLQQFRPIDEEVGMVAQIRHHLILVSHRPGVDDSAGKDRAVLLIVLLRHDCAL